MRKRGITDNSTKIQTKREKNLVVWKRVCIFAMPNNSKELRDILYRILRILLSTQVTLWVVWRQIQRGYALFLYNAKLVRQMPNNYKQATKAKNSNLYAIDIVIVISTIIISILLLIFAPSVLMAIAKFIGVCVLVALAVIPMLHAINILKYEQ